MDIDKKIEELNEEYYAFAKCKEMYKSLIKDCDKEMDKIKKKISKLSSK